MPRKTEAGLIQYDMVAWRERMQLTQAEVAETMGVSVSTIWRYEKTQVVPLVIAWACYGLEAHKYSQSQVVVS